ncbi:MAG: isoleucine--tRNA ligase [Candidatus Omnitrophica bacterium]|nr:isoleucine--tRNA ligase [Candidatus Omnitrophota bacterium]MCM8793470.1 isoleucine--tRNA ligase [Candidatus Omnitrophota bacterium]
MSNKTDYKNTLNLPRTEFPMKANLPQKEPQILEFWEANNIYEKIKELRKNRPKYILHDGPPYANGDIHLGHALNKTLKDIVVRFYNMQGFAVPFIPGWDCHGLPVEHQLFKELGITKHEISQLEFRKQAYQYAMNYVEIQKEEFKRLGILGDFAHPYLTLSPEYEAEIIRSFAKLVEKGFIYKGVKPVNWCINCETALAEAEVEYENHTSPSIYVKFGLLNPEKIIPNSQLPTTTYSLLIWTTTPWTLISNVAVALNPDFNYCLIKRGNEVILIAEERLSFLREKFGFSESDILLKIKGKSLEGFYLRHPFLERNSRVILADFVSSKEGTGCVHIAPGHGEEDYLVGKLYHLPVIMPLDEKGVFNREAGGFSGMDIYSANRKIIQDLEERGVLLGEEKIEHLYPHCWRCKKPIIFRATSQWFMSVDHLSLREKAKEKVRQIKWVPAIGENRITGMLETRPDWCLSRQRYWGVPIPAFYCGECGELLLDCEVMNYVAELFEKDGSDIWFIKEGEELLPPGKKCNHCGGRRFLKETDILDVWFESGVSHQAVLKKEKELNFPADLYLEGSDQHRGWFQTSLLTSMGIGETSPFKTVLTHGFVVDGEGRKMSKSLGNVISPEEIVKKFGADVLRLWAISSDFTEDMKISEEIVERVAGVYRKWRNTAKFILGNLYDFDPDKDKIDYSLLLPVDQWALAKTEKLLQEVLLAYKNFDFHKVYRLTYQFCVMDMSAVYLDIIKDRLYTSYPDSLERRSAQTVIFEILNILVRILAPLIPFTAEEIWSYLPHQNEFKGFISVHMLNMPEINLLWLDEELLEKWNLVWKIRDIVMRAVEKERIKKIIGDSLEAELIFYVSEEKLYRYLKDKDFTNLAEIFLVSEVRLNRVDKIPLESFRDEELLPNFGVEVMRASGNKCQRCWNYSLTVGKDSIYPDICNRCLKVMTMIKNG